MASDSFLLQLRCGISQLAQLNEASLATMGVLTHLGGGTAHENQDDPSAFTQARPLLCRMLTRVSHTHSVEASTFPASQRATFVPVEHSAVGSGAAADDVVLRRLAARAFRDRQGFLHCLFTETTTTGADGPGLSKGVGEIADGSFAGDHGRHSADAGVAVGLALVRRWVNHDSYPAAPAACRMGTHLSQGATP